jgi:parallel beta-helix repeat protein
MIKGFQIGLDLRNTYDSKVFSNTFLDNRERAIVLNKCTDNLIYHNNIIKGITQALDFNPADNDWHHPTLLEGNYWSRYSGADDGSGSGKHAVAGDGIGDTLIPHPNMDYDYYPLMNPLDLINCHPIANAGYDRTGNEGEVVKFNGLASYDPDGLIISYKWDFGDGSPTESGATPNHIYSNPGNYTVTLTVKDNYNASDSDTCIITVLALEQSPVADAGPDQTVNEGDLVQFNGNGSYDPGGGQVRNENEWFTQLVDSEGDVGRHSSLALEKNGYPHICYFDWTNKDLKYAKWTGSAWDIITLDSPGYVGNYNSMALDTNDNPHIGYFHIPDGLKYAKWDGSTWNIEIVENFPGGYISMALDSQDYPHISYSPGGYGNYTIKYAKWTGSSWEIETVVDFEKGGYTSIALDSNDNPVISYIGWTLSLNNNLKLAKWTGSSWVYDTVDYVDDVGHYNSLVLDSNDYPHISYCDNTNDNVKYAKWTGSSWSIEIIDSIEDYDGFTSLALDSNDNAHICYFDNDYFDLKYARWTGSSWSIETVERIGKLELYASLWLSIKLDKNENPHISYYNGTNKDLKYAKKLGENTSNLTYSWDFNNFFDSDGDGNFINDVDATGPSPIFLYGDDGIYTVTLTVTNAQGLSDTDTCNITVVNVNPTVTIESATMDVEIGLRVAGRKYNNVSMTLFEQDTEISQVSIERMPGSPNEQMKWINLTLNMSKTYSATVTYEPEDPPNVGGNPVWIYIKFENGSIKKIHHTFNVQQSKKKDSDHWNHVEPWEVDLNAHLVGYPFEINYHVTDPGSDDEVLTFTYGSQNATFTYFNDPLNPDPYPSPEVNPVDISDNTTLIYEGLGTVQLQVEDDDGGLGFSTIVLS